MMKMQSKVVYLGVLAAISGFGPTARAADEPEAPTSEQAAATQGTLEGVLVAKGDNWIEVKTDDAAQLRFRAPWIGGAPTSGGGPDAAVIQAIKALRVPNRVRVQWKTLEGPRVVSVEMLEPKDKAGQGFGVVTAKGENWIEIKSEGRIERYWPRWMGTSPASGGGLDKEILRAMGERRVGDKVCFEWLFNERKRVTVLKLDERK